LLPTHLRHVGERGEAAKGLTTSAQSLSYSNRTKTEIVAFARLAALARRWLSPEAGWAAGSAAGQGCDGCADPRVTGARAGDGCDCAQAALWWRHGAAGVAGSWRLLKGAVGQSHGLGRSEYFQEYFASGFLRFWRAWTSRGDPPPVADADEPPAGDRVGDAAHLATEVITRIRAGLIPQPVLAGVIKWPQRFIRVFKRKLAEASSIAVLRAIDCGVCLPIPLGTSGFA
jgi:hypothetical protein